MFCPKCHTVESKVIDSRHLAEGQCTRRRRQCGHCGFRFTTYENVQLQAPVIVKRDGRREDFDRQKILKGLNKAFDKRPVSRDQIMRLIDKVEAMIIESGKNEVQSKEIGELIMKLIYLQDKVAFIRFASFYWVFDNIEDFVQDLETSVQKIKEGQANEQSFQ